MDINKESDKNVAIKESIEIVKKFNKENRYRDCGRVNNAIDALIFVAENSIPVQKVKETVKEVIELIESEQFKIIMGDMTKVGRIKYLLEKLLEEK